MIALLMLMALSPAELDALPVGRYLERPAIVSGIAERSAAIAPCGAGLPNGGWPVMLRILGTGRPVLDDAAPLDEGLAPARDCLARSLAGQPFPDHDEEPLAVSTTIVVQDGVAAFGPAVTVEEREADLLFLFLPPDQSPDQRDAVRRGLGLDGSAQEATGGR